MHPGLAVTLYLRDRKVVVVGSAPTAMDRLSRLAAAGAQIVHEPGTAVSQETLTGAQAVFAHTGAHATNAKVVAAARAAGALAYAHDAPDISDFAMPALVRRGPITLAISTSGTAPALARVLRERLQALFATGGNAFDRLVEELSQRRRRGQRDGLYELASTIHIDGKLTIEPGASSPPHDSH